MICYRSVSKKPIRGLRNNTPIVDNDLSTILETAMAPESKLVAYQLLTPDKNYNYSKVELYNIDNDLDGLRYYLALCGSHGAKYYLLDSEAELFKQKENIILVPSEEDFIRRNE